MAQNQVHLQLHALAYNLGSFLQSADLPEEDPQLVIYELADPSNQDRGSCRSARPCHDPPTGRGHRQQRPVPPYPGCHPPPTTTSVANMACNLHAIERKRHNKCARNSSALPNRCRNGPIANFSRLSPNALAAHTPQPALTAYNLRLSSDVH